MSGVALVTGGGRGLGRAFALALAQAGMRVAVAARTREQIDETAALLGGGGLAVQADVTDQTAVSRMVARVEADLGPVELLVNNAGAGPPFGPRGKPIRRIGGARWRSISKAHCFARTPCCPGWWSAAAAASST